MKINKKIIVIASAGVVVVIAGVALLCSIKKDDNSLSSSSVALIQRPEEPVYQDTFNGDGFIYHELEYGGIVITGADNLSGDIVFPSSYEDKSVVEIGPNAFKDWIGLGTVEFNQPMMFNFGAFEQSSIEHLIINGNAQSVTDYPYGFSAGCFKGCKNLKTILCDVPMGDIEYETFAECSGLTEVEFTCGFNAICSNAFKDCTALEVISLPVTVVSIDDTAFAGCTSLKTIKGYKNTYVEEWSKQHNYEFIGKDIST